MFLLTNYISEIYTDNKASYNALINFNTDIKTRFGDEIFNNINPTNNRIFGLISEFDFEKLYVSYTSSDSIFYRFKLKDSLYEIKWEVFLDNFDECESALHIYKNSIKEKSTYGSIDYIYSVISDVLFNNGQNIQYPFEFFWKDKTEIFDYA